MSLKISIGKSDGIRNSIFQIHPHLLSCCILTIITVCLYLKVIGQDYVFSWDDRIYITGNSDIRGFTLQNLKNIFTTNYQGNYAPIHLLSYMVDNALWGLSPAAVKMVNVLLHTGSTLVFYRLLVRLGFSLPQALFAALLFAVHPVQVESVAWASQRKNTLSMLFFLISWYLWDIDKCLQLKKYSRWYLGSIVFFVLALLTKSIAVILPLFLLSHELFLDRKPFTTRMLVSKLPYLVLAGACFAFALTSQQTGGGRMPYFFQSFWLTMMNMLPVFSHYLTLLLFPSGLSIIYNAPIKSVPDLPVILSSVVFILFVIGCFRLKKQHPVHFFWIFLFIIALLPVSNVIPLVTTMNDRYLYYPMLGFAPFAVLTLSGVVQRFHLSFFPVPVLSAVVMIIFFSGASWKRLDVWDNSLTLWSDALSKAEPGTWYGMSANYISGMYAMALMERAQNRHLQGNIQDAQHFYILALEYDPTLYDALLKLSNLYLVYNRPIQARPYLVRLVESYKKSDESLYFLGLSYLMTNELRQAEECFHRALEINPQNIQAAAKLRILERIY